MEHIEIARHILADHLIPAVRRDGVGRLLLPGELAPHACADSVAEYLRSLEDSHGFPDLVCSLSEETLVGVEGRVGAVQPGYLLLVPPYVRHSHDVRGPLVRSYMPSPGTPTVVTFTMFSFGATLSRGWTTTQEHCATPWYPLYDRGILQLVSSLMEELERRQEAYEVVGQALLLEIMGRIRRAPSLSGAEGESIPAQPSPQTETEPSIAATATAYLLGHYEAPLTLAAIARHLFVSPSHLAHEFKRATGKSVMAYLTEVRLDTAKALLGTGLNIAVIAELVGYRDPLYFSRIFRRREGQSPSKYRAR